MYILLTVNAWALNCLPHSGRDVVALKKDGTEFNAFVHVIDGKVDNEIFFAAFVRGWLSKRFPSPSIPPASVLIPATLVGELLQTKLSKGRK